MVGNSLQIFVPACCLHERCTHYCYILLFLFVYALVLYHAYFSIDVYSNVQANYLISTHVSADQFRYVAW